MNSINYLEIIITGVISRFDFLADHFYSEFKKNQQNFISKEEYFLKLKAINNEILEKLNKKYYKSLDEYYRFQEQDKNLPKEKRFDFPKPKLEDYGLPSSYFLNGKYISPYQFNLTMCNKISTSISEAMVRVSDEEKEALLTSGPYESERNLHKLKWIGAKNQLYNVLRQLKNEYGLITNSYNELADFLMEHVTGFENTKKETIEKELKKKQPLPKSKRININPDEKGAE
jgi:hypothetical protein